MKICPIILLLFWQLLSVWVLLLRQVCYYFVRLLFLWSFWYFFTKYIIIYRPDILIMIILCSVELFQIVLRKLLFSFIIIISAFWSLSSVHFGLGIEIHHSSLSYKCICAHLKVIYVMKMHLSKNNQLKLTRFKIRS